MSAWSDETFTIDQLREMYEIIEIQGFCSMTELWFYAQTTNRTVWIDILEDNARYAEIERQIFINKQKIHEKNNFVKHYHPGRTRCRSR